MGNGNLLFEGQSGRAITNLLVVPGDRGSDAVRSRCNAVTVNGLREQVVLSSEDMRLRAAN